MNLQVIPRTVIGGYLSAARLPLNAVARVRGQQSNEQWAPTLAYEGFEAGVETVLGSLLRDETLVERGRLRQAKVAQLRKAAQLETIADTARAQSQEKFAERREQAEAKRKQAAQRAEQREAQVEREAQRRKEEAERKAAKKTAAARAVKSAQDKAIDRRERALTADALEQESQALKVQQEALDAAETVDVIEDSIEGTKADRKTG